MSSFTPQPFVYLIATKGFIAIGNKKSRSCSLDIARMSFSPSWCKGRIIWGFVDLGIWLFEFCYLGFVIWGFGDLGICGGIFVSLQKNLYALYI